MKQILVPTDFSTCADNAVNFAVQSAKILPAEITLIHAFDLNDSVYADYMGVNREFNISLLNEVEANLASLKKEIKEKEGLDVGTTVYKGNVQAAVLQASEEKNIDVIVMGTLGAGGLKEKLWGSKTASVIGKTKIPLIAIPISYIWQKPEKFLLATNHFEEAPGILNPLFELANLYMALVQVAVFTDEENDKAATFLEHTRKIPEYEKMLKEKFREKTLASAHIYGKDFEETLQAYIEDNEIDILAMVTYQRNFWDRIFHPSRTKMLSYHTKIPLLVIPAI